MVCFFCGGKVWRYRGRLGEPGDCLEIIFPETKDIAGDCEPRRHEYAHPACLRVARSAFAERLQSAFAERLQKAFAERLQKAGKA